MPHRSPRHRIRGAGAMLVGGALLVTSAAFLGGCNSNTTVLQNTPPIGSSMLRTQGDSTGGLLRSPGGRAVRTRPMHAP